MKTFIKPSVPNEGIFGIGHSLGGYTKWRGLSS